MKHFSGLAHVKFQTLYLRIVRAFDGNKITINKKKDKKQILRVLQIFIRLIQFYPRK